MENIVICDATTKITSVSQSNHVERITIDLTSIIIVSLLIVTAMAAFEYYRQIQRAHKEYEKAKNFIEDIVLSFDRELKRESNRFKSMVSKVDGIESKSDISFRKINAIERLINPLQEQYNLVTQANQSFSQMISQSFSENTHNNTKILSELSGLETKIKDIEATQETLKIKITEFEEQIEKVSIIKSQEIKSDIVLPPIPIRRDKALGALTDTEITVLEMLLKEGAKTAPEIKERVKLSREHTARLMKKLFEEGYLEREEGKIPFRYRIKKEMETLLQKSDKPIM